MKPLMLVAIADLYILVVFILEKKVAKWLLNHI